MAEGQKRQMTVKPAQPIITVKKKELKHIITEKSTSHKI